MLKLGPTFGREFAKFSSVSTVFIQFVVFHPFVMFSSKISVKLRQWLFQWCQLPDKWKIIENTLIYTDSRRKYLHT